MGTRTLIKEEQRKGGAEEPEQEELEGGGKRGKVFGGRSGQLFLRLRGNGLHKDRKVSTGFSNRDDE